MSVSSGSSNPIGVLLVNLGSPSAPTSAAVKRFLDEFLSDPMVVDANPILWRFLRRLVILPRRSPRVAKLYASIWMPGGSPLMVYSHAQRDLLAAQLGRDYSVVIAMRYGEPSIASGMRQLEHCRELVVVPMFPQYSRSTTGSIEARVSREVGASRARPNVRGVPHFFDHPLYIASLAARVRESLARGEVDHFVFSFHGLPVRYIEAGDPYRDQCVATASALARELELPSDRWSLVYQSRFGPEKWLEPAADVFVPKLAAAKKRVLVVAPGFMCDCLETIEELGARLRESFLHAGGSELRLVPCINDHPSVVPLLEALVRAR